MAEAGVTKLEAVNDILHSLGRGTVAALDTGGASDAADAERILDRTTIKELARGWPCNTIAAKTYTSTGTPSVIDLNSVNPLRVECVGPGRYAGQISLRGSLAYIVNEGTTDFGSATTITLNVYTEVAWADLSPDLKEVVLESAKVTFRRYYMPDADIEFRLQKEADKAELMADRLRETAFRTQNVQPILLSGSMGGGGEGQRR